MTASRRTARLWKASRSNSRRALSPAAGGARVIDGPFAEAKEAIGGYVKLMVESIDEATAIAQQHPGLDYGLEIEVREMTASCHLGVQHHPTHEISAV